MSGVLEAARFPAAGCRPGLGSPASTSCEVTEARSEYLPLCSTVVKPGVPRSTRKPRTPSSVCAQTTATSAMRAVGDPRLLAVEHPAVAVAHGAGAHAARVGAEVGLGEAEAADRLAARRGAGSSGPSGPRCPSCRIGYMTRRRLHRHEGPQARVAPLELLVDEPVGDGVEARAGRTREYGAPSRSSSAISGTSSRGKTHVPGPLLDVGQHPVARPSRGPCRGPAAPRRSAGRRCGTGRASGRVAWTPSSAGKHARTRQSAGRTPKAGFPTPAERGTIGV